MAACLDNFTGTYPAYLYEGATTPLIASVAQHELMQGGDFWKNTSAWLEHETTFNLNRVRAPVLFTLHGSERAPHAEYFALDIIGAFRINKKPLEYVFFPQAEHPLLRPQERYAAIELVVDWMRFWLNGEYPSDRERAERWVPLRKQQDEVLKTPPPPKGKWVFLPDAEQPAWTPPTDSLRGAGSGISSSAEAEGNERTSPAEPKLD